MWRAVTLIAIYALVALGCSAVVEVQPPETSSIPVAAGSPVPAGIPEWLAMASLVQVTPEYKYHSKLAWTEPKQNIDGTPLDDLAGYQFAVTTPEVDLNASPPPAPIQTWNLSLTDIPKYGKCENGECEVLAAELWENVPQGLYRVWALAYDDESPPNASPWTPSIQEQIPHRPFDAVSPAAIQDFRAVVGELQRDGFEILEIRIKPRTP